MGKPLGIWIFAFCVIFWAIGAIASAIPANAGQFSANATVYKKGVVISWHNPKAATGGLEITVAGSDGFRSNTPFSYGYRNKQGQEVHFFSGKVVDRSGKLGTFYKVTEIDPNTGERYVSLDLKAS